VCNIRLEITGSVYHDEHHELFGDIFSVRHLDSLYILSYKSDRLNFEDQNRVPGISD